MRGPLTPWLQLRQQVSVSTSAGLLEPSLSLACRMAMRQSQRAVSMCAHRTGTSPPRTGKPRQGRELPAGEHITYDVCERRPGGQPPQQLQSNPITIIKTAAQPELRQLIAVNSNYICYALNETRLRLLNKHTADKGPLLRDHTGGITDLRWQVTA